MKRDVQQFKEDIHGLAKSPSKFKGSLDKSGITSLVRQAGINTDK